MATTPGPSIFAEKTFADLWAAASLANNIVLT
jgi:hypothetical protein